VLALRHLDGGIGVDAVLTAENEVSIVFSFTRSYFHVDLDCPAEMVGFLKSIMPKKPVAELYISIGYNKHGKTELYRDLLRHLRASGDRFEPAAGDKGLVMEVFTLPSWDEVFKIIRDTPGYPKRTTHQEVMDKYRLVFRHDKVGRLVDAQEFEHLRFPRARFTPELLDLLLREAPSTVSMDGDSVVFAHLFFERRVTPLNLFLRHAEPPAARAAVLDWGWAIKDLAAANIFPGDLLLKNFGVTRHGRVVFYDYDEVCLLTDCVFRRMPPATNSDDELDDQPWFSVGDADVFPEEFVHFLGLEGGLRELVCTVHADLFDASFWRALQDRLRAGEVIDPPPYRRDRNSE
jgi:isocitrate dehydrogenase kinase/phosphatase